MTVKLLTEHHLEFLRLKGGCTCSSESMSAKMPHCWESHVGLIYIKIDRSPVVLELVTLCNDAHYKVTYILFHAKKPGFQSGFDDISMCSFYTEIIKNTIKCSASLI